jgi:hypothetical protein
MAGPIAHHRRRELPGNLRAAPGRGRPRRCFIFLLNDIAGAGISSFTCEAAQQPAEFCPWTMQGSQLYFWSSQ